MPGADQTQPSVCIFDENDIQHYMILGTTGRGKSTLLENEALRRGVSYDELLKELEPTEEQKEAAKMREQANKEREDKRMAVVRDAYWQASNESEFHRLHNALVSTLMKNTPTVEQLKSLFMMLPDHIIGLGIAWGFGDTEVGDEIHTFIEENRSHVAERLGLDLDVR